MAEHWCPEHGLHGDWHPGADGAYCAWEDGSGTCGQYPIAPTVVQAIEAAAHVRAWDLAAWMIMPNGESSSAEVAKATRDKIWPPHVGRLCEKRPTTSHDPSS